MSKPQAIWVRLTQPAPCSWCGLVIQPQAAAVSDLGSGNVWCLACTTAAVNPDPMVQAQLPTPGTPGASARREHERRKAADEQRIRARWGRMGGLVVAGSKERPSTHAWECGAIGEERLGTRLNRLIDDGVAVLHDRRIPGSRANIDHLVITPAAVWVIDAKRYKGRPERKTEGGLFRPRTESLRVGGRDRTHLVDGVLNLTRLVQQTVCNTPVKGALCFVDADWPLSAPAFSVRDVVVATVRRLTRLIGKEQAGNLDVHQLSSHLAAQFPSYEGT